MAKAKVQKDVFWKAAVITGVIFIVGIALGIWIDTLRVAEIQSKLVELDIDWNDARLQSAYYQNFATFGNITNITQEEFCAAAIESNLAFNEKIYQEGLRIEHYEKANRFSPELIQEKKRYALLQLQFYLNAVNLKNYCGVDYSTLVYFYSHYNQDMTVQLNQKLQAAVNLELKDKCGPALMLIPLPADLNITTINLITENYNITTMPAVLINENVTLQGLQPAESLERYIKC